MRVPVVLGGITGQPKRFGCMTVLFCRARIALPPK